MARRLENKIENIDLNVATRIMRTDIGYNKCECHIANEIMAGFLNKMGVYCSFQYGELVYVTRNHELIIVHRDCPIEMGNGRKKPYHCWLEVDGKVLDIAIGAWTYDLQESSKKEYIYGDYNNGFTLGEKFGHEERLNVTCERDIHSYRPLDTLQQTLKAFPDANFYRNNKSIFSGLEYKDSFKKTISRYEKKYKEATRDSEYRVFDDA